MSRDLKIDDLASSIVEQLKIFGNFYNLVAYVQQLDVETHGVEGVMINYPDYHYLHNVGDLTTISDIARKQLAVHYRIPADTAMKQVVVFYHNLNYTNSRDEDNDINHNIDFKHEFNVHGQEVEGQQYLGILVITNGKGIDIPNEPKLFKKNKNPKSYAAHCKRKYFMYFNDNRNGVFAALTNTVLEIKYPSPTVDTGYIKDEWTAPCVCQSMDYTETLDETQSSYDAFISVVKESKEYLAALRAILIHAPFTASDVRKVVVAEIDSIERRWSDIGVDLTKFS